MEATVQHLFGGLGWCKEKRQHQGCYTAALAWREAQDVYFTVDVPGGEVGKFDSVVVHRGSNFLPKTNQSVEQHKFNNRIEEDYLIKESIACRVKDMRLGDRLLPETMLTLTNSIEICKVAEQTQILMKAIDNGEVVHTVRWDSKRVERSDASQKSDEGARNNFQHFRGRSDFGGKPTNLHQSCRMWSYHSADEGKLDFQKQPQSKTAFRRVYHYIPKEGMSRYSKASDQPCYRSLKVEQSPPILGLSAIQQLDILQRVEIIDSPLLTRPVCVAPMATFQRVPFSLHDKLNEELDRMLTLKMIEKVTEPIEWLNPIVIVNKPNGEISMCLDPQPLNAEILREHYRLSSLEAVTDKLKGA
ncbi:hypothetical protein PR048_013217 [Dryococelus australis]|uniref:Uncharacterized protein n=1 Tax=Dryococelus australis TaxID=614101 RepID=A0ABQ9HT25_9NEOP|nr:hypothetical protein PR048_013217 [Dryococelus australis]